MIVVQKVSKSYGRVRALDGVSLDVPSGEALVILGRSGSGKTTLLRLIAGLEIPDEGEIYLDGRLASSKDRVLAPHLRGIGFVFQAPALWPHLTLAQNIRFGIRGMSRQPACARVSELLSQMDLDGLGSRYPHQVSGGEARRAALARALAVQPALLLMDEPLLNLDPELKERMLSLIGDLVSRKDAAFLYVTHDSDEASRISKRRLVLERGRLL
jgi:ABC-type sulfate/molybdate transport systems ATPase subunit